jgi:hypothetical protein
MESLKMPQPRQMDTSAVARCRRCGSEVFSETIVEREGVAVERIVAGSFRQALDPDGSPYGPIIPFCNCGG